MFNAQFKHGININIAGFSFILKSYFVFIDLWKKKKSVLMMISRASRQKKVGTEMYNAYGVLWRENEVHFSIKSI